MSKIKYAVIIDGETIGTRKSDRTYTHVVIGRNDYEQDLARAKQTDTDASNWDYYVRQVEAGVGNPLRYSDGTMCRFPVDQDSYDSAKETVETYKTLDAYLAAKVADRIAKIEASKLAGCYSRFEVLTWCGRLDLAHKQLTQWPYYRDHQVAPVTIL